MLYQKIPSGRFWIMPNDFFEKYKLTVVTLWSIVFWFPKKIKKEKVIGQ